MGLLARVVSPDLIDESLRLHGRESQRRRDLPAHARAYRHLRRACSAWPTAAFQAFPCGRRPARPAPICCGEYRTTASCVSPRGQTHPRRIKRRMKDYPSRKGDERLNRQPDYTVQVVK
ncbi:transposase domain-containing protein [Kushneria aurantia]|uniref:Transposase domain-containing protein n=1 Tax=Kushneria aurantia TaxID=504092 RepID=A0ABV6G803_9GAMM